MTTKEQLSKKADEAVNSIRRAQQAFEHDIKRWVNFSTKDPKRFKKQIKTHAQRLINYANTIK